MFTFNIFVQNQILSMAKRTIRLIALLTLQILFVEKMFNVNMTCN